MIPTSIVRTPRRCPRGHTLIYREAYHAGVDWCCLECGALWGPDWPTTPEPGAAEAAELQRDRRRSFGRLHPLPAAQARREARR